MAVAAEVRPGGQPEGRDADDEHHERGRDRGEHGVGARHYTPELTKVLFQWKVPLNVHWTCSVKSTDK